jgi:hypothetical protein
VSPVRYEVGFYIREDEFLHAITPFAVMLIIGSKA